MIWLLSDLHGSLNGLNEYLHLDNKHTVIYNKPVPLK